MDIPTRPNSKNSWYSFVFLDEFQDTTAIQYAFVKECFWNSGTKVTSVGDNKQRIMVWAGAVKTIFNDFYRELNPKCIRLIMNHRSAPRLVALQKAMYESLKEKATEVCASGNWAEDDGNIALFIADNEQLEAAAVSKDILLKISNGVEPHDICILCKQKPQDYASAVIEELEKHGVRARIETGYQDLIKEPIVDLFIKFMICADSRKHPNEWTFIEELLVELWGISGMRENDTFDEMQRKLSAVVNVVKKNIQHIFHVLLVIYRPGVDLHAPAVEQFHQLRLILQKHIPGMHIVGIGALDIMFHVQIGLIIQKAGFNVRAQLLEMLHGDMVEGGNEHLLLHLAFADFVDHPLLQILVKHLVVFQFHVQQHLGLLTEVQQLAKGPDMLTCKFRRLPSTDIQ